MASLRKLEIKQLLAHLEGEGPPLVITGSRGSGKTTLCKWLWHRVQDGPRIGVAMWIGDGGRGAFDQNLVEDVEKSAALLFHQAGIKHRVRRCKNEKEGPALPYFEPEGQRLFLLVDGLDHLQSQKGVDASFLPMAVPAGTRLVVSVSPGPILETLAARGWQVHGVAPLNLGERCRQVELSLAGHKEKDKLRDPLVAWLPGAHPTHLAMAIALAQRTGEAPAPTDDVPTVVGRLLDRLDMQPTEAALLTVCERGIPKVPELGFSQAHRMRRLEPAVVERGGVFEPATPEVRQALQARCGADQLRAAHVEAFELYSRQRLSLFYKEAAEHLLAVGAHERLADFLTQVEPFQQLNHADIGWLARCWRTMGLHDGPERHERMLEVALPSADASLRVSLLNNVGLLASDLDWNEAALCYRRRALEEARKAFPATHSKVGTPLLNLAHQLQKGPDPDAEEERIYQEMLSVIDGPTPIHESYPSKWLTLRFYATFLENHYRYEEGQQRREEGIEAARRALGANHPSTAMEILWTGRAICWRRPRQALAYAQQAYEILRTALGSSSERTVFALRMIATTQREMGLFDQAIATSRRALEMAKPMATTHPEETGYALDVLSSLADARNDRPSALAIRQEHYQYLRKYLGPAHATTLASMSSLALRLEMAGKAEPALEVIEKLRERYRDQHGPDHEKTRHATVVAARLCWHMGQRAEAERRLNDLSDEQEAKAGTHIRVMVRLLRSEWAREDGQLKAQRNFLEQALAIYQEDDQVNALRGCTHLMMAGHLFLSGDREASARHHEAGAPLIEDGQLHLKPMIMRPYQTDPRADGDQEAIRRRQELETMFTINGSRQGLDLAILCKRALRVAWNPADGRTLAVLDHSGQTHLFTWHAESLQLERLALPLAPRVLPKDLAATTLRWSASGGALRLATLASDESIGTCHADEAWTPASPVSPDGRTVVFFGRNVIFVMHAP